MNVVGAWKLGYTGKGVVITILDDGIQTDHPDLLLNYVRIFICVIFPNNSFKNFKYLFIFFN